jgi:hypothetical protein
MVKTIEAVQSIEERLSPSMAEMTSAPAVVAPWERPGTAEKELLASSGRLAAPLDYEQRHQALVSLQAPTRSHKTTWRQDAAKLKNVASAAPVSRRQTTSWTRKNS